MPVFVQLLFLTSFCVSPNQQRWAKGSGQKLNKLAKSTALELLMSKKAARWDFHHKHQTFQNLSSWVQFDSHKWIQRTSWLKKTRFVVPLEPVDLTQIMQEYIIALFITFLLTPCKQRLVDFVLHNQRLNILKKCYFDEFRPKNWFQKKL